MARFLATGWNPWSPEDERVVQQEFHNPPNDGHEQGRQECDDAVGNVLERHEGLGLRLKSRQALRNPWVNIWNPLVALVSVKGAIGWHTPSSTTVVVTARGLYAAKDTLASSFRAHPVAWYCSSKYSNMAW